ncbi:MAG: PilZ domain-containing protein [Sedimentisphaerales bacterium]|nr:PilZ domain-containing protein [Sedimentisphaerales bacterium]
MGKKTRQTATDSTQQNVQQDDGTSQERRQFCRYCQQYTSALSISQGPEASEVSVCSQTDNISNGGCYLVVPQADSFVVHRQVELELRIPRQTLNTYMLETVCAPADILRVEPKEENQLGLALQFNDPLDLQLD